VFMHKLRAVLSLLRDAYEIGQFERPSRADSREQEREHKLVATFARGNLSLQSGRYMTAEDLEGIKASLRNYSFAPRE